MRGVLATLLLLVACGDDHSATPADAAPDGTPPPPECPAGPLSGAPADQTIHSTWATPSPTIHAITVEWAITGDSNTNATVAVRYRTGGGTWHQGFPLKR